MLQEVFDKVTRMINDCKNRESLKIVLNYMELVEANSKSEDFEQLDLLKNQWKKKDLELFS